MERSSSDTEESTMNFSRKIDVEQNLKENAKTKDERRFLLKMTLAIR